MWMAVKTGPCTAISCLLNTHCNVHGLLCCPCSDSAAGPHQRPCLEDQAAGAELDFLPKRREQPTHQLHHCSLQIGCWHCVCGPEQWPHLAAVCRPAGRWLSRMFGNRPVSQQPGGGVTDNDALGHTARHSSLLGWSPGACEPRLNCKSQQSLTARNLRRASIRRMTDARPLWDMAAGSASRIMDLIRGLRGLAPAASMPVSHECFNACFTAVQV